MLATGGSARMALRQVRPRFDGTISFIGILGAPYGVAQLLAADPALRIFLAALDERLNEQGYILPGLGDAGDRLFGAQ
jgi:uracil phosphoribosyltransferase